MKEMYYISYGSNMNIPQMDLRCLNARIFGNGKLKGWKLVFNYHADIIFTGNNNDFVPVVVWILTEKSDLENLDRYEGFPVYYTKKNIDVVMDDGKIINAMVYVMAEKRKGIFPPGRSYFECILDGYIGNRIETAPLYDALKYCCKMENITKNNQYYPV